MTSLQLFAPPVEMPDLASYDVILINSSAGKDSQSMLDYVVEQADAAGINRSRLVVFHADLGRVSKGALVRAAQLRPDLAREYADLEERIGHRFRLDLSMAEIIAEAEATQAPVEIEGWAA